MDHDSKTFRASAAPSQDGYDYKALRDRLRKSWGLPSNEDPYAPRKEETEKGEAATEIPVSVGTDSYPGEEKRKTDHDAALHKMKKEYVKTKSSVLYANKAELLRPDNAPARTKADSKPEKTKFTARDVRQWVIYDAVLGRPRCLKPWRSRF